MELKHPLPSFTCGPKYPSQSLREGGGGGAMKETFTPIASGRLCPSYRDANSMRRVPFTFKKKGGGISMETKLSLFQ